MFSNICSNNAAVIIHKQVASNKHLAHLVLFKLEHYMKAKYGNKSSLTPKTYFLRLQCWI